MRSILSHMLDHKKNNQSDSNVNQECLTCNKCRYTSTNDLNKSFSYAASKQVSFANITPKTAEIFECECVVENYLEGIVLQNSGLVLIKNHRTLVRQDHESMTDQVKILSGGAARLDPLLSGLVGPGMLTASVFGELTSSPSYLSTLAALRILSKNNTGGILVLVMNNLADRLNFGLACQEAAYEGIKTMCLTVGEDCSGVNVKRPVGRGASCGILFLMKIAGAMSEDKKSLYEICCVLKALKGGSLGSVNIGIQQQTVTIGSGLKGEPGKTVSEVKSVQDIVNEVLFYIFNPASYFSLHIKKGDDIAVIVNNLGKLNDFYLNLIVREVIFRISSIEVNVVRIYSGRFMTSAAAMGFSVSVLKVNENVLKWLDHPVNVMSWPIRVESKAKTNSVPFKDRCYIFVDKAVSYSSVASLDPLSEESNIGPRFTLEQADLLVKTLFSIVKAVTDMEDHLNMLDLDHDYGSTLKKFMLSIKSEMDMKALNIVTPYGLLNSLGQLAASSMGGVSGAVFSVLFCSAAQAFVTSSRYTAVSWNGWIQAAGLARDGLCAYCRVQPGDGTILDALHPFVHTLQSPTVQCLSKAVAAAMAGAEATVTKAGSQDATAFSLAVALRVLLTEVQVELREVKA